MRAHWKQFLALFFAIAVAITSGVIVTTRFQAANDEEVHHHSDDCYIEQVVSKVLTCTIREGTPENAKECTLEADESQAPICGYTDGQVMHYHTNGNDGTVYCLDGSCGLKEGEQHFHNKDCYPAHVHDENCYDPGTPHVHTDECCYEITTEKVLVCGYEEGQIVGSNGEVASEKFNLTIEYQFADWDNEQYAPMPQYTTYRKITSDGQIEGGAITTPVIEDDEYYYVIDDMSKDSQGGWNGTMEVTYYNFPEKDYLEFYPQQAIIKEYNTSVEANGTAAPIKGDIVTEIWYLRYPKKVLDDMLDEEAGEDESSEKTYNFIVEYYHVDPNTMEETLIEGAGTSVPMNGDGSFPNGTIVTTAPKGYNAYDDHIKRGVAVGDKMTYVEEAGSLDYQQEDFKTFGTIWGEWEEPSSQKYIINGFVPADGIVTDNVVLQIRCFPSVDEEPEAPAPEEKKTVTIKYEDSKGTSIKPPVTRDLEDGETPAATEEEKAPITYNDKEYTLKDTKTETDDDGNTIITLVYGTKNIVTVKYVDKADPNRNLKDPRTETVDSDAKVEPTEADMADITVDGRTYTNAPSDTTIVTDEKGDSVITLVFALQNITEVRWVNEEGTEIKRPEIDTNYDESNYPAGDTVKGTDGKTYVTQKPSDPETKANGDKSVTIICVEKLVDVTINFVDKDSNPIPGKDPVILKGQKVGIDITGEVNKYTKDTIPVTKDGKDYEYKFVGNPDEEYKVAPDNNIINLVFDPEDIKSYNLKVNYWKSGPSGQDKYGDPRIVPIVKEKIEGEEVVRLAIPEGEGVKNADGTITPSLITPAVSGYLPYKFEVRDGEFKGQDWDAVVKAVKDYDPTIVYDDVEKTFVVPAGFDPKALAIGLKNIVPNQNYEVDVYYAPYSVANGGTNPNQPGTTPGDGKPGDGQPTGGQPTGGQPTGGQPTGGQPTGGQPTGGQPTGGQPTGTQPGNTTPTPNQTQTNTPAQPGSVTPVQPGNTTPVQPQVQNNTPAQPQVQNNTPAQPALANAQPADTALNNAATPGETPAVADATVADEASATSSTSYVPAAAPTAVPAENVIALAMEQTPTGNVQLTQVDDIEAALADFNFGHVCNILYFLIIAGTIVVLANYFRMSKKHSKRVFELRGELGEDDPYKKN